MARTKTPHPIDKSRLDVITRKHDVAMAAAKKSYDDYKGLQASVLAARKTLNRLTDEMLTPVRARTAIWEKDVAAAEAEIARLDEAMRENRLDAQILQERSAACSALKDACIAFLEGLK